MKKAVCILFLLPVLLVGCRSYRHLSESVNRQDSVQVRVETRVEYVPDTVLVEIPVERFVQVQDTASHLETSYAISDAFLRSDGRLYHSLENKAQKRPYEVRKEVVYKDSIIYRDRNTETVKTVEVERKLTWWQKTQMRGFWAFVLGFASLLAYKKLK